MDETPANICRLFEALAAETGRTASTVSRLTSGSGDTYARLRNGKRITTERAVRIVRAVSRMWPADLDWPADIPRPAPSGAAEDAA